MRKPFAIAVMIADKNTQEIFEMTEEKRMAALEALDNRYETSDEWVCVQAIIGLENYETIRACLSERGWQPIDTAPRDGTEVIIFNGHGKGTIFVGFYVGDEEDMEPHWARIDSLEIFYEPTHWHPLPQPPKTGG